MNLARENALALRRRATYSYAQRTHSALQQPGGGRSRQQKTLDSVGEVVAHLVGFGPIIMIICLPITLGFPSRTPISSSSLAILSITCKRE